MADSSCDDKNHFDNYFSEITLGHCPGLKLSGHYMVYLTSILLSAVWLSGWGITSCQLRMVQTGSVELLQ